MVLDITQGSLSVAEYEEFFLSHEIVNQKNNQYLIQLDRDGLKKDIREGLESTEFATLRALFQEASEIEEILEMEKTPPTTPRGRKRKTMRFGDPEDEHPWDNPPVVVPSLNPPPPNKSLSLVPPPSPAMHKAPSVPPTSWPQVVPSVTPPPSLAPTLHKAPAEHKAPSLAPTKVPS
ncbi:hypothetical protein Bca4012_029158 [Brassica carinata]|uniref:Uncharacterized protein n=1 Tax=Brassica carinata TaxID=52824 RepID=A0A8X7UV77_BRACI|nr:hypothetical protein Bca52824_049395 [Brassica carinata]